MWTRFLIISTVSGLPDIPYVTDRLFEIPRDFSNVFRIYYGEEVAGNVEQLFRQQLNYTVKLLHNYITAKTTGNQWEIENTKKAWYKNADKLADYLSKINPAWDNSKLKDLFRHQLQMTEDEIGKRTRGDYSADVYLYDFIEYYGLMMADIMADGIIKQFYT